MLPEPLSGPPALLSPWFWAGLRPPEPGDGRRPWGAECTAGDTGRGGSVPCCRRPKDGGRPSTGGSAREEGCMQRGPFLLCRGLPFCRLGLAPSEAQEPEESAETMGAAGPDPSTDPLRLRAEPTLAGCPPPCSLPRPPMGGEASPCRASCSGELLASLVSGPPYAPAQGEKEALG